jgi:peptidoglycan/LPS O-acetylase OafA/YrhL
LVAAVLEVATILLASLAMTYGGSGNGAALLSVPAFALVVIVFAHDAGPLSKLLMKPALVAVGAWSYSIYMIHFVMLVVLNHALGALVSQVGRSDLLRHAGDVDGLRRIALDPWLETGISVVVVLLVVAVASQSFKWIEAPARRWAKRRAKHAGAPKAEAIAPTI